jgi:GNAT superfamily N-acetyltransferase
MKADLEILPLSRHRQGLRRFLRVAAEIQGKDPSWVAPLESEARKTLSEANPFFEHAEMQLWVASRGQRDVGRIAGILDREHNRQLGERTAFFGFFESVEDPAVSGALFAAVVRWARERAMSRLMGPMNPSSNDECGLLVDGFGMRPALMMPYNPAYYPTLVEAEGLRKSKDLWASFVELRSTPLRRLERVATMLARRHPEIWVRPVTRKTLKQDWLSIREVYNEAWEENWGFVPMTERELEFMVERLKPLLMEGLVSMAGVGKEAVGFLLALPDFNEVIQPLRGRWLSPSLPRVLPYLMGWRRPRMIRLVALGVKPRYQRRGVESSLFVIAARAASRLGFVECEASWMLEDNVRVNRLVELFGGTRYKTYRLYERDLD